MIVTLLSFVNLCTAQAKIGAALNETAKEISQYTYFYSLSGLNDIQKESVEDTADTRADADTIVTNVSESIRQLKSLAGGESTVDETAEGVKGSLDNIDAVIEKIVTSDNPSEWAMDLIEIGANEGYEMLKGRLSGALTLQLMKKHLKGESGGGCDAYLKHLGVVGGIGGLDCGNSALFAYGSDDIILNCRYELRVLRLLDVDITYPISQNAYTKVWGGKALLSAPEEGEEEETDIVGGAFAMVGDEDGKKFGAYASQAAPEEGYVGVIIHTSADRQKFSVCQNGSWVEVDHRALANWLKSKGYDGKTPVRLISCGAGGTDSRLAQDLANKLGVEVKAPSDTIWADKNGNLTIGPTKDSNTGHWNQFQPGVNPNADN